MERTILAFRFFRKRYFSPTLFFSPIDYLRFGAAHAFKSIMELRETDVTSAKLLLHFIKKILIIILMISNVSQNPDLRTLKVEFNIYQFIATLLLNYSSDLQVKIIIICHVKKQRLKCGKFRFLSSDNQSMNSQY